MFFHITLIAWGNIFLYARLQMGRIMVWWCPSVWVSVRPSDSPSVPPSVRLSVRVSVRKFSPLFSYMLWHIELKFCIWLCFTVLQIKFKCHQFPSIFVGVMPLLELKILEIHSFPHFSLTYALTYRAEILHMTLLYCTYIHIKFECPLFALISPLPVKPGGL